MKKHIPNVITSANLLCGCLGVTQIAQGEFVIAAVLVLMGAFFDFFDGLAARLLKVGSAMGAELDSLADVITFGLVPSYLVFEMLNEITPSPFNYLAFSLAVFSAVRLAKFNTDSRQTDSFIGLPTPANALFWISFPLIAWQLENSTWFEIDFIQPILNTNWIIYTLIILFSYLLVAELPLLSLKFKSFTWKGNEFRFILLLISTVLIAVFLFSAIPFIITLYLILSIIQNNSKKK